MKRIILILSIFLPIIVFSQEKTSSAIADTLKKDSLNADSLKPWKASGTITITTNQASYTNWAAGGQTSFSVSSLLLYTINYKKGKSQWDNTFKLGYGKMWKKEEGWNKSDDIIDISSKYGYKSFRNWYYSIIAGFSSQFDKGYNTDSVLISEFMAPGYLSLSIGMDYKLKDKLTVLIAPLAGKITYVRNDSLANAGAFGVEKAVYDETTGEMITPGEQSKSEFGGSIKIGFKQTIMKNIKLSTKLDLFSNYLENPENVDVNWELDINMKVNKYITATVSTKMVYDDNIQIGVDDNEDGTITDEETHPRLQFKEVIGVGVSFAF